MQQVVALLPMKDHSERVPNKNIRKFCGRPLYHWIVDTLLASKYISFIVIDTDSKRITEDACNTFDRIRIINRPDSICGDYVSMNKIIGHDIAQIDSDHFLQTHSTNPLLSTETINRAIESYYEGLEQTYDSLFTVTPFKQRFFWPDGTAINHDSSRLIRTQDLKPIYKANGNIYIFSKKSFAHRNSREGLNPKMFEMDSYESIEIDEEMDFKVAELLKCGKRLDSC